jgi:hypothetical protein
VATFRLSQNKNDEDAEKVLKMRKLGLRGEAPFKQGGDFQGEGTAPWKQKKTFSASSDVFSDL